MSFDDEQFNPLDREVKRPDGGAYVVRAVPAGEPLRDYGVTGTVIDLFALVVEMASVALRHWIKPGWTVGVFLWRRHRLPRLVHKERLAPAADPSHRVDALCAQLAAGWRPGSL